MSEHFYDLKCSECKHDLSILEVERGLCEDCYREIFFNANYCSNDDDAFEIKSDIAITTESSSPTLFLDGSGLYTINVPKTYRVDASKIKTLDDVKLILSALPLQVLSTYVHFDKIEHLLVELD